MALGDGNLSNPNGRAVRLRVSCDLKYPYLIGKISRALVKAFPNNKVSIVSREAQGCLDVCCYSNKLEMLLGWKAKSGSKFTQRARVPKWVWINKKYIARCLCGLIETDGTIYSDRGYKMVMFSSIIPELAEDVDVMIWLLGFQPHTYKIIPRSKFKSQPCYHVRLSKNVQEFLDLVKPEKL